MRKLKKKKLFKRIKKIKKNQNWVRGLGVFVLVISLIAVSVYIYASQTNKPEEPVENPDPNFGLQQEVENFFTQNDALEMIDIIKCESHFRHFSETGEVLQNTLGSSALGIAQIMSSVHPDPRIIERYNKRFATSFTIEDFDINILEDNLAYALILYRVNGTKDWECSKKFRFNG